MEEGDSPIRPYLKWAGGKRQLLPEIKKHLPRNIGDYTYYEPFVGAGAVFFALRPKRALINDSNGQLILTYNVIRENTESLINVLKAHEKKNGENYYYEIRNMDRDFAEFEKLPDVEKAARFIFLNKTCFNGLYRVNSRGLFNVPRGKYKNPSICEETTLRQISAYLNANKITVLNTDFEQAVLTADSGAFIYFDPPYHNPEKTGFTEYQAGGFDEKAQKRLRDVVVQMTKRGTKCLVSNSDTDYIRGLYSGDSFEIISVQAKRLINADSARRGAVNEVLIKNWKTAEAPETV